MPSARSPLSKGSAPARTLSSVDFPAPFTPDQRHALAALDGEVHAAVHDLVSVGLVDVGEAGRPCRPVRGGWGNVKWIRASARVDLDPIDLVEHLDPALHLPRLGRLIAEAVDEALDLGHALGLVARARLEQRVPGLALHEEVIVVAGVDGHGAPDQVGDRRHHAVQEVPVVGDEHHAAVVGREEVLQPPERLEIEVVGRLVEQQEVGAAAGAGVPAPPACAIRRRTRRADDAPPPARKPSPLRMTLAWASSR